MRKLFCSDGICCTPLLFLHKWIYGVSDDNDIFVYPLTDAAIQQVKWDPSKIKDKLKRDIEAHVASVRAKKLSELCSKYEVAYVYLIKWLQSYQEKQAII